MNLRMKIAMVKLWYSRGKNWGNYLITITNFLTFLAVVFHISGYILLAVISILIVSAFIIVGFVDQTFGIWKSEQTYANRDLNPFFAKIADDVKEIKDMLKNEHN